MYLTPQRFRTMGFGIDISELDDAELQSLIAQATMVVDAYCNVPRLPQRHDFRGGAITGEQHAWRYPQTPFEIGQRRYYPWHWPIVSIEKFRIYVTNTQYVEIAPTELMINNSERYLEVVSLAITSSGLFNALIVPNVGLATPIAKCDYTYGWDFEESAELLMNTDGQTYRAQNQYWRTTPAPEIKKNGTAITTGFAVDLDEGAVIFDAQLAASDTITASYHHKLPPEIQYGCGYIVAYLHGKAELQARGMGGLTLLKVAEVTLERDLPRGMPANLMQNLDILVPEAALLLGAFRDDNFTVR